MQQLEVQLLASALGDLGDIHSHVLLGSGSDAVAERFVDRLLATCERIGLAPWGGTLRDDLAPGLRTTTFERRILIVYRIEPELVDVVNLFYKGRDVDAHFKRLRMPGRSR